MYKFKLAKLLKILLVTALIIICVLALWALVIYVLGMNLQWWAKVMILSCLALSLFIAVLVRKLILKRREMKFVDGIIGPDEMPGSVTHLSEASRQLKNRFKQAVVTMKKSHLKHQGNPLYVLPWYLLVGRSGAGKSTAIKSARLPSPFGDLNKVDGIEGTRNCDWWFFDESVVIDIAGRFAVHRNEELDEKEWLTFLEHLVKYRKQEPINGVIVTAEASRLLESSDEKNEEEGQTLRKRIDELTSVMGAKIPVYLLVTKTDLVYGIERYYRLLTENSVSQAMGLMNHDNKADVTAFVNKTIDTITEKLKDIRLIMANDRKVVGRYSIEPEILLFPNEFSRLRKGLTAFCRGAFKENPFQEKPFLRGIYFSSGCQEGNPINSLANSMGKLTQSLSKLSVPKEVGSKNGYFLFDFFAKILPTDRALYSRTVRAQQWENLTHNLWLAGFVAIILVFCILATYSWNENRSVINSVSPDFQKTIVFTDDPIDDISVMAKFSRQIKAVEVRNDEWQVPRLGLKASIELEQLLKQKYCKRFKDHFDEAISESIERKIANGGWSQSNYAPAIQYIPFIVRRVNMINGRFNKMNAEALSKMPAPNFAIMMHGDELPSLEQEIADQYKDAYVNYLVWQNDNEALNQTLVGLQGLLKDYFHEKQGDLRWLVGWANENQPAKAITLNDFWHSDKSDEGLPVIRPVFSGEGRQLISDFVLNELEKAIEEPRWIIKPKEQFLAQYKKDFYGSWQQFALNFSKGKSLFTRSDEWASTIGRFSSANSSPYLDLIKAMEKQLLDLKAEEWPSLILDPVKDKKINLWLGQVRTFGHIRTAMASSGVTKNRELKAKLNSKMGTNTRIAASLLKSGMSEGQISRGKEAVKLYLEALAAFDGITDTPNDAYEAAKLGFGGEGRRSKSPIFLANRSIDRLRDALKPRGGARPRIENDPFWCLIVDPIDELWRYCVGMAGNEIQRFWRDTVIMEIEHVNDPATLGEELFGSGNLVEEFKQRYAGAFMGRSPGVGYHGKKVRNRSVSFTKRYLSFLNAGGVYNNYVRELEARKKAAGMDHRITLSARPTDVNIEARVRPHMTRLTIESLDGNIVLENRHYPIQRTFTWNAQKCGDVTLEIMLGDITLTRSYRGDCGFCEFVKNFPNGRRSFRPKDFSGMQAEFKRLNVTSIDVEFQYNQQKIRRILQNQGRSAVAPGRPPTNIVTTFKAR